MNSPMQDQQPLKIPEESRLKSISIWLIICNSDKGREVLSARLRKSAAARAVQDLRENQKSGESYYVQSVPLRFKKAALKKVLDGLI